ncbi:hypothetical protein J7I84_08940 [Arthrobacter sp. ISL-85]|uniref:HNH endonuclease n=1 Tax=Arthrobacter sp. ISL-85 TaxID=2819115 RepID=UPI001BECDDE9|nr:hypothetical protein [Arthrobacter sp. ISL-85]MBT2566618.1 hypothetical protein [Arthrobacter sp. ISL-85]
MPWLKEGDAAANHPIVLSALEMEDADDRILNECFGWVNRCATQSAAYEKDYIITIGTARQMAGSITRYHALVKAAKFCGYLTDTEIIVDGEVRQAFKLVEDNDLFHMILKDERAWTNQRKKDQRNPELTVPVRHRDGDACRYCGKTVNWSDRVSGRAGSYDHTNPGRKATVETYVVCCKACNGQRADDPDSTWETLPAPTEPLYGPQTVEFLANHDVIVTPTYTRPEPQVKAEDTPPVEQPTSAAPGKGEATAPTGPSSDSADPGATASPAHDLGRSSGTGLGHRSPRPSHVGTGRDGTGQVGKGAQLPTQPPKNKSKRRRPRSRGRN